MENGWPNSSIGEVDPRAFEESSPLPPFDSLPPWKSEQSYWTNFRGDLVPGTGRVSGYRKRARTPDLFDCSISCGVV